MGTFVLLPQFITDITAWLNIIVTTKLTNSCFCNKIKWSHVMCHIEPRELFGRNIFHPKMTSSACDSSLFLPLCESNFSHVKNIDSNKSSCVENPSLVGPPSPLTQESNQRQSWLLKSRHVFGEHMCFWFAHGRHLQRQKYLRRDIPPFNIVLIRFM